MSQVEPPLSKILALIQCRTNLTRNGLNICKQHPFFTGLFVFITVSGLIFSTYGLTQSPKKSEQSILSAQSTPLKTTLPQSQHESLLLLDKIERMLAKQPTLDAQAKKSVLQAANDLKAISTKNQYHKALQVLSTGNTVPAEKLFESFIQTDQPNIQHKAQAYRHLGALAYLSNRKNAFYAYQRATKLAPENANAWNRLGILSKTNEAMAIYQRVIALKNSQHHKDEIAVAYGNLGVIYKSRKQLDKAVECYQEALTIYQALNDQQGMATQYANLGVIFQTREQLDKALEYYKKRLVIETNLGHEKDLASAYGSLGAVYQSQERLGKSIEAYKTSLKISTKLGDLIIMANIYGNLGIIYKSRGEIDKAIAHYMQAVEINSNLKRIESMASNYSNLGVAYTLKNDNRKAKYYWKKSLKLFQTIKSPTAKTVQNWLDTLK